MTVATMVHRISWLSMDDSRVGGPQLLRAAAPLQLNAFSVRHLVGQARKTDESERKKNRPGARAAAPSKFFDSVGHLKIIR
jgi:hypothetical protein